MISIFLRVASLALPAFLASAAGTVSLQDAILARYACPTNSFFETFRQTWSDTFGTSPPAADVMHKHSLSDRPGIQRDQTTVESDLVTCEHQASFRAAAAPHSGDWLHALPSLHAVSVWMMNPFARQWVCGWGATSAFHMRAFVALRLMPVACMPSFANGRLAKSPDIRL